MLRSLLIQRLTTLQKVASSIPAFSGIFRALQTNTKGHTQRSSADSMEEDSLAQLLPY
jgi:hypothetical protein